MNYNTALSKFNRNNLENNSGAPFKNPKRFVGLEKVYFDGSEILSSSKFALILGILKNKISEELHGYTQDETKNAYDIVKLAENLQLLYLTIDSPLYSTQSGLDINILAQRMTQEIQESMKFRDMPRKEQEIYQKLYSEVVVKENNRRRLLQNFISTEIFLRLMKEDNLYDVSCLLGMSNRVRSSLDTLSSFNKMVTERFNLMRTDLKNDNVYKVNFVLGHIDKFKEFHNNFFPFNAKRRKGKYHKVFNEIEIEMPNIGLFKDVYNFDFNRNLTMVE